MELPLREPAPVVTEQASVFRDLFETPCQCRPVQHDLTGVLVLPNHSIPKIARGILDRADQPNRSRCFAEAPWREDESHHRRLRVMLQPTQLHRWRQREALIVSDETRCAPGGSWCDDVDRHDHPGEGPSPLAHHPVTSCDVSGPVRFPLARRLSRRDEARTPGEAAVAQQVPALQIPTDHTGRHRLHTQVDPVWRHDPALRARHAPWRTTIALASALVAAAIRHQVPLGVVVFDAWSLAADVVQVLARRRKAWISLLNTNRRLDTARVPRRDAHGWPRQRPGPHLAVEALVPLLPAHAERPVTVGEHSYGGVTLAVRLPGWGNVRLVVSVAHEALTGRSGVLVTNRVAWSAATIIRLSSHRWPTDPVAPDGQGPLGFPASRLRSADAMGKHWCLVFVASSLRHLTCLPAGPGRTRGLIHTLGDACRHQGRVLLQKRLMFVHDQ